MLAHPNPRAQERFRIRCWLTISVRRWKLLARAVDMSASGAMIESLFPVSVGSFVRMRSQETFLVAAPTCGAVGGTGLGSSSAIL
jgi:hypothetical protein